jgi:hypothetical protein
MYGRRPLTRLEAALYAALLGIFVAIFAQQMLGTMELAERAAMQATLINTTSAINVRLAQTLSGRRADPADWSRRNPFELAGMSPPNFAHDADLASLESGQWAYDPAQAELIYRPRLRFSLKTSDGQQALRFRLVLGPVGYSLQPRAPFTWE